VSPPASPAVLKIAKPSHGSDRSGVVPGVVASTTVGTRTPPPFERFLAEHGATVMRFLVVAVGSEHADDVYQETFLSALRAYHRVRDDGRLDRWILRIASRTAIDHHRREGRLPRATETVPDRPVHDPEPLDDGLWSAVGALPAKQRVAVVLRHLLDRPYDEIATVLGSSEEAARASVSAGLKTLREQVG
jgi:RNA polymerase sigma factor (sigma-70 family)